MPPSNAFTRPASLRDTFGQIQAVSAEASTTIDAGDIVRLASTQVDQLLRVELADAGDSGPLYVALQSIPAGQPGRIGSWYVKTAMNTAGLTAGSSPLYLTADGDLSTTVGNVPHRIGTVLYADASAGVGFISPSAFGGNSTVLSAEVVLTAAQMNALNTTPITVIADPGDGYAVLVDSVTFTYRHVTTGPTCQAGEDIVLVYASAATTAITDLVDDAVFNETSADKAAVARGGNGTALVASEAVKVTTLSGDWANTAGSTMRVHVLYRLVQV